MKKFIDFIMQQPIWKVVLGAFLLILLMFQAKIMLPILLIAGLVAIWYFIKKKPDVKKRNVALLVATIATVGTYITGEPSQTVLQQVQHQETVVSDSSETETSSSSEQQKEKEKQEKLDREKKEQAEKERKLKLEKEKKAEEERKLKEEQERKAKEEKEKKEAETKQLAEQGEQAVKQLEDNQVNENIAPAQAAVDRIADPNQKEQLRHRIVLVQEAITTRERQAQEAAEAERQRQAAEAAAAQQAQAQQQQAAPQSSFRNCSEARAAGAAPIYRGQPGYAPHLDRDGDGIACER